MNCLVWAAPGSGKSFLVEEVAREVGAKFHEINVATMTSFVELKQQLESLHSVDADKQLVMIDEFVAKIGNSHVFPALLVPLWTKIKTKKITFVLVDSYPQAKDIDDFRIFLSKQEKGPDLVSRINGPQLSLAAPDMVDRAVLVASLVRRMHPKSAFAIERGALNALVGDGSAQWSPRSIEYVVEALTPSGNVVRLKDLEKINELCTRMGLNLATVNGGDQMKISDI
jgi:hypothetical protein